MYFVEKTKAPVPPDVLPVSAFLCQFSPISAEAAAFIDKHSLFCTIPKGKVLLRAGQVCPYIFLVIKGLFRGYIMDGKTEITTWITPENDIVSSSSSFFNQSPSLENIQALEDSEMIAVCYEHLESAYQQFPEMNVVARKILQVMYRDADERAYLGRLTTALSRYQYFVQTRPEITNRLQLKYVASYLSITNETLSRLRATLLRDGK